MGRKNKPLSDCLGYEGHPCKEKAYHYNAYRCKPCSIQHEKLRRKIARNDDKLSDHHRPVKETPNDRPSMSLKEYDKLIDVLKNLPE